MDKAPSTSRKHGKPSKHGKRAVSPLSELIKCFCGTCESFFMRRHVIQAFKANEQEILSNPNLLAILKKFVEFRLGGSHIKPPISEIIECYELCDGLLTGTEDFEDRRSDLEDLCFTEGWENQLNQAADDDTTHAFFQELMGECTRRLGEEPEYHMFKEELAKKLHLSN